MRLTHRTMETAEQPGSGVVDLEPPIVLDVVDGTGIHTREQCTLPNIDVWRLNHFYIANSVAVNHRVSRVDHYDCL